MLDNVSETIERHPGLIALAVLVVATLAYLQSRNAPAPTVNATFAGGGAARGIDPAAAAIEEAAIGASTQQFSALTGLLASEGQTAAQRDVGLAQISAAQDVANEQTSAGVTISGNQTAAQIAAATINAQTAVALSNNQRTIAQTNSQNAKDIARAADNTSIGNNVIGDVFKYGGAILTAIGL